MTGLWANELGLEEFLPIEAITIPTNNKLELELTGQLYLFTKESVEMCQKIRLNIIKLSAKKSIWEV